MDGLSIAASLTEIRSQLEGGVVRNIYQPARTRFIFRVFAGMDTRLLIDLQDAQIRVPVQREQNPASPSPFAMRLRKHLKGGHIERIRQQGWDRVVVLEILRREGAKTIPYQLVAELTGMRGNLHLLLDGMLVQSLRPDHRNQEGHAFRTLPAQDKIDPAQVAPERIEAWLAEGASRALAQHIEGIGKQTAKDLVASVHRDDPALELTLRLKEWLTYVRAPQPHCLEVESRATFYPLPAPARAMDTYQEALAAVEGGSGGGRSEAKDEDTTARDLRRGVQQRQRTIEKLEEWLLASGEANALQARADLLMIHHSKLERGLSSVCLVDPASSEEIEITLDPSLSAIENAQSMYRSAQRIRRGHPHVHTRLKKLRRELDTLEQAQAAHRQGLPVDAEAAELLKKRGKCRPPAKKAVPFREIEVEGYRIWVGKSASRNDALLRAAAADDIWMHAKDFAGSHVVVRTRRGEIVPDGVLEAAARLAALHSKAKTERWVDVSMTEVRHVRKPKGAPAGLVNVRAADTLTVELRKGDS